MADALRIGLIYMKEWYIRTICIRYVSEHLCKETHYRFQKDEDPICMATKMELFFRHAFL